MQQNGSINKKISNSLSAVFWNNFFYAQLAFAFHFLEDFYIVHRHIGAFSFLFFRKISV